MISVRKQETLPRPRSFMAILKPEREPASLPPSPRPCQARGPEGDDQRESPDLSCPPHRLAPSPPKARPGPWVRLTGLRVENWSPRVSPTPWCSQLQAIGAGEGAFPGLGPGVPAQRPLEERGSLRLCSSRARPACGHAATEAAAESPTRPQATAGPSPGTSGIQGRATAPLPNTSRTCPQLWEPAPSRAGGLLPPSVTLLCPQAPKVPRHPHQQN